jgi:hypothetical protein
MVKQIAPMVHDKFETESKAQHQYIPIPMGSEQSGNDPRAARVISAQRE